MYKLYWYVLGRRCLHDQPPVKPLGTDPQSPSLVDSISRVLSRLVAGGMTYVPCDSARRGLWDSGAWLPLNFVPCAVSLC